MNEPHEPPRDEKVGYKQPPIHSRFKPGQSGNPRGRPKKGLDVKVLLEALTTRKVSIMLDGRRVQVTSLHAMLLSHYNKALKGDARSFERIIKLLDQHGVAMPKPAEAEAAPLDAEDDAILEAFLRSQQPLDDAA